MQNKKVRTLEDFLQQPSFSHFDFATFAKKELKEEISFSSLHKKFLKPLLRKGELREERHTISTPKEQRTKNSVDISSD